MDLNILWFLLLTLLFIGYTALDGFDLGVGSLHLFAKSDSDRRKMINSIAPVWDGNEVWLITAGGALFAAFPDVYATVFSGFYIAMFLLLTVLIGRAVSMEFRSKVESELWRSFWDKCFSISSIIISILLGVAFANIIIGIPIDSSKEFVGSFFDLLGVYQIIFGLMSLFLIMSHGAVYTAIKTEGELQESIIKKFKPLFFAFIGLFAIINILTWTKYPHVVQNIINYPLSAIIPIITIVSLVMEFYYVKLKNYGKAFFFSFLLIASLVSLGALGIFPYLAPSSINPAFGLNIYNSASSQATLKTMFIITIIGMPLVLTYTIVIYRIFRGKVKLDENSY